MIEQIVLGIVQGVAEWLPISSEGMIVLVKSFFFPDGADLESLISGALFLHLGTFLAALIYFRSEVKEIILSIFKWKESDAKQRKTVSFLVISTLISGTLGLILLELLTGIDEKIGVLGARATLVVGLLLLVTGFIQVFKPKASAKEEIDLSIRDGIVLGFVQGFTVLPGLSRSGLTVSALLLSKFSEETSLKLSFLMSLPIVLAGNIVLNFNSISNFEPARLVGLLFAFAFGYLTIGGLLKLARKINFGWFVVIFGVLSIIASFVA